MKRKSKTNDVATLKTRWLDTNQSIATLDFTGQLDLLVKSTPIPCWLLIGGIITHPFLEPMSITQLGPKRNWAIAWLLWTVIWKRHSISWHLSFDKELGSAQIYFNVTCLTVITSEEHFSFFRWREQSMQKPRKSASYGLPVLWHWNSLLTTLRSRKVVTITLWLSRVPKCCVTARFRRRTLGGRTG